jgi:two-component system LytT family sensor kinase
LTDGGPADIVGAMPDASMTVRTAPTTAPLAARSVLRRWAVVVATGSTVATFAMLQIYVSRRALGEPPPLWVLVRLEAPIWVFWMCAAVPIVMLARALRFDGGRRASSTAFHLFAAVAIACTFVGFRLLWYQAFNPYPYAGASVQRWFWLMFRDSFLDGFILYWAILGVYHAYANLSRVKERDLEAAGMRARLAEANLQALKMQLRPHFLFNTLNTASAVLEHDPRTARRILGRLGELLRASLHAETRDEVSLAQEIETLRGFLEIEQARFGPRLTVQLQLAPDTLAAAVPSFLLQPLVENAVHHGIATRATPGHLSITSVRTNGHLELHVVDDGPGLADGIVVEGIGLSNTRQRLRELYGSAHAMALQPAPAGGLHVIVRVPFRPVAPRETRRSLS